MPRASVSVFASLVSAALLVVLPSAPTYTLARSPWGTSHNDNRRESAYKECRAGSCQIAYLNSVEDFCLWAPSYPGSDLSATGRDTEHTLTAWCIKSTHGTQLILGGTISWARFVKTAEYVQVTGVGNLTNINAPTDGVASASEKDDPGPGLVFTSAYGQLEQIYDWTSFVSQERFCFRACNPSADTSTPCPRIHDIFGCTDSVPGNHGTEVFEDCIRDAIKAPSTSYQGVLAAPSHFAPYLPPGCTTHGKISNAGVARARRAISSMSFSTSFILSDGQSTSSGPSIVTTSTDSATTITFPPFPTPTLNTTTSMNTTTSVSLPTSTSMAYSFNHTRTLSRWPSHSHSSASTIPLSSSYYSFSSYQPSSSTGFSSSDPSSTSSPTSFTSTFSTSNPSSSLGTATPSVTPTPTFTTPVSTPTPTPTPTSLSPFPSSYGMSSSLSEPQPSPYSSFPPSASSASPTTPPSMSPSISSPSSVILTFTTSLSPSSVPGSPTSSTTPPSMPPSTSSQSLIILTFTTLLLPSSVPSPSPSTSPAASPNSATQVSTQCPPPSRRAVNAGSITFPASLLPLICTLLMIAGVFIV